MVISNFMKTVIQKLINVRRPLYAVVGLICLSVITYFNTVNSPFIWDDEVMVQGNGLIRSLSNIPKILSTSPFGAKLEASDFYRPFQTLTYAIDYSVWGLEPTGYHITNIVFHSLTMIVLFLALLRLNYSYAVALTVAAIVTVHPLNTEAVTYISGRGDVLYLFLCMVSLYLITWVRRDTVWIIPIVWISYSIALLTKENSVPLGVLLSVMMMFSIFFKPNRWQALTAYGAAGIAVVYSGIRLYFLGALGNKTLSWIASASVVDRLKTIPYILVTYARLMVVPINLHMEYHYVASRWLTAESCILIALVGVAIGTVIVSSDRKKTAFWLAWFGVCLGPVLQFTPLASTLREHWITMAQIGIWVVIVTIIHERIRPYWIKLGLALSVITIFCGLTISRNIDWMDPMALYSHDSALEPRSFLLHNNKGVIQFRTGDYVGAKLSFEAAINNTPNAIGYGTALNNLGVILEGEGKLDSAEGYFRRSIMASQYELGFCNLARLLVNKGDFFGAESVVRQGLSIYPYNGTLMYSLVVVLFAQNRAYDAELAITNLMRYFPEYGAQIQQLRANIH